ncbi:leucine-rich PPR motif-containing protein, mitochondrial isoform X2 [Dunckerocampus dactyliophorus]|uniref:leucine-rich PPR motif-containing protein, mitochondrial isoform X2 n=1 Tax=Dunckerocampus dactyliophorus TaxID=161453 RepID=UPI002405927F|nr:leucine-rich PPR motif-containing protein, mitochondrial isoform X2 [Dunckerocampus dactyliophorus]
MAALLRSARLLKFSPLGLLQIAGTKRTGPPLDRLYSGTLGVRRTGVLSRQNRPSVENTPSHAWPYATVCVRHFTVATEKKDEISIAVRSKQAQNFDWALSKLDSSVRRTGRITKTLLLRIFHDVCRTGYPSGNQGLLLLRSCGTLLPEIGLQERTELAHRIWERLQELGVQYDVSHYNALLKVYLQNEFKFSPMDFLAKMEAAKVQPNRVTYQRLIAAYCQNGDIEGASAILGFMKSKDLPITEAVFNALVTGHARSGDIESAKNILSVMRGAGIDPGPDTYVSLLNGYAERGDLDSLKKTLEDAESADFSLVDRDIMQVIFTLAKAGHQQHVPEMMEHLRQDRGYIPDAMNLCLSLVTQGLDETAFTILKTFSTVQSDDYYGDSDNLGSFFLRHCVNMDMPLEKIGRYCTELQDSNMHASPLSFVLLCALEAKKTDMSFEVMKMMQEQNLPIRPHYFWPLLSQHVKDNNTAGAVEVMKAMQHLGVAPDLETVSNYFYPVFPNTEAARQAFEEAGIVLELEGLLTSKIRFLASSNLARLYTLLSDPSHPPVDFGSFRSSLIHGFRKSDDIECMVKLTKLFYNDERFTKPSTTTAEMVSYFLYNLIDGFQATEVQEQEDKLRNYFNQLKAENIIIPVNIYRGIRNILESYHVPELLKDVLLLVDPAELVSSSPLSAAPHVTSLQRALELRQQYEDQMNTGAYAILIGLCCRHDKLDEALGLKREMSRKDSSAMLDAAKYLALIKLLAKNDRVEEAVDLLKEMKEKDVVLNGSHASMLFHTLNSVVSKGGGAPAIQRLQDTVFTLGLAKPTANLCGPLISAYLKSDDLPGALEAALECQKRYGQLPRIHDIIVCLVEKGDTELLQKAMDVVSQERGEMTMLYYLLFAFLQTGRYREARKIVETPGLRARPGRLQWYAERCILTQQMEPLEQMVDMTSKLFECDRDEMYSYIFRLCKETNNWQKAEATWTKMQEENVIPRERTLRMLAEILKNNGQEVPFEVPETFLQDEQEADTQQVKPAALSLRDTENGGQYQVRLISLCKKGKAHDAFAMLKETDKRGVALTPANYDYLIRALLAGGSVEDAMAVRDIATSRVPGFRLSDIANSLVVVTLSKRGQAKDALETLKSMLQQDQVPLQLAITRLVQTLGSLGNLEGIKEVMSLIERLGTSLNLSSMMFINNMALAHIKNGDLESAVEMLEEVYTRPENGNSSMSFVFRKILMEENEKAIDKLSAMAERLATHFACYRPATDLFVQLLEMDKVEDAKYMLARVGALAEQKESLISYLARMSQRPGQVGKVKTLLSLIPDFAEKEVLFTYLMKCHVADNDLASARALYERMQEEGVVADELSLKRLAVLYRHAGETAPFPEPPESFKFYADKLRERTSKAQLADE